MEFDKLALGSKRSQVADMLDKQDPDLAAAFRGLSSKDKAAGKLVGKMFHAKGLAEMNAAFTWYEQEYGQEDWFTPLSYYDKIVAITANLPLVAGDNEKAYRAAVKIWAACQE